MVMRKTSYKEIKNKQEKYMKSQGLPLKPDQGESELHDDTPKKKVTMHAPPSSILQGQRFSPGALAQRS
jgi:hypothetical protein